MTNLLTPTRDTSTRVFLEGLEENIEPCKTYKMHIHKKRVKGNIEESSKLEAIKQMIYKYLNTEQGMYLIYSNFGLKKRDVFFKAKTFAYHKVVARIERDLSKDDRINSVDSFEFIKEQSTGNDLSIAFRVNTIYGNLEIKEVLKLG